MSAKKERKFAKPAKPYSLNGIVKKIIKDREYARYIHREVVKARRGDRAAANIVKAHFKPKAAELKRMKIRPSHIRKVPGCPMTTQQLMLAFAAHI
jgi:hypothetical protein